ncbi:hypothetical protein PR002_g32891 [Phytophthora rubi]|uniref:Uncharacterized protein n=1 Tax=Phytophthora rubi TaxID=129364 RepID=A0A6A3G4L0_9STRA|nr:hypothetical protein PR002_g32891 [Phytophthora rubi]
MPVLVAGFVLCCWCQLPAWSLAAGLMAVLTVPAWSLAAGLMAVLTVPVLVASLMCCWRCQLPA